MTDPTIGVAIVALERDELYHTCVRKAERQADAETLFVSFEPLIGPVADVDLTGIDWAIVGGESGPEHREMDHAWAREILDAARRDYVAYFFKQSSAQQPERGQALTVERSDGVTIQKEIREMPELPQLTIEARSQQTEQDTLVTDGGVDRDDAGLERDECTIMECSGEAEYAYWMPDIGHFSKIRGPSTICLTTAISPHTFVNTAATVWRRALTGTASGLSGPRRKSLLTAVATRT